jgi:hypothetical protein
LTGSIARAGLYLLLMLLVALPLIPGLQKEDRLNPGQKTSWTEPTGELREVLERQRRALLGDQLGVIDLQQPGAVALVSFDYASATQGEMRPMAEAVIGRLRGQGMRIIAISLEPEGPILAQQTLEEVFEDRPGAYGADVINMGYIPGQMAGIRGLMAGDGSLSTLVDVQDGLTLADRAEWEDIRDLGQVSVVVTIADNPATARWWIEQMEAAAITPDSGERLLLAATSAVAEPFLRPYREARQLDNAGSAQLDGMISGINGAAALESVRNNFGPARKMLDSQSVAHLLIVILIAAGTIAGWMPPAPTPAAASQKQVEPEKYSGMDEVEPNSNKN